MNKVFMKRTLTAILFAAVSVFAYAGDGWITSLSQAQALSKKTGKPILADFTGSDWCHWCIQLHKEVFSKPEFKAWAKKNVILLELDYPQAKKQPAALVKQNEAIAKKYKVNAFPTVLFISSTGKELGRSGYAPGGPKPWVTNASKIIKK
jgi:thioredoxin-related protein